MKHKYLRGALIKGRDYVRFVMWDGIRNYENEPPISALCAAEQLDREMLLVVKIDHAQGQSVLDAVEGAAGCTNDLVVWARDHRTYRFAVDEWSRGSMWRQ
jgi:hypothetical protein